MTHTKKAFIVAGIALAALGVATLPATADNHIPGPPHSLAAQADHSKAISLATPLSPLDNHMP
ncbi:hypothetical protein NCG97_21725 [Streptomyces lydicamycinicus]|uniref:Uncharacterized protein n=1 Tax=Streptomyces lydicamycinicus TaxID=1546107 RepID=A0A0P4R9D3_9ACTN|nr:hypothetical protein [Streptomyces lydicamycinicus]USA02691.1 hypothetical protein NCG97_21725 [Streptomyces lydicamycinicus]GAO09532.1 hypothetical protein TPA0598_05_02530 [Streptomyces lydicamycinicus]